MIIIHGITGGIGRALYEEALLSSEVSHVPIFGTERADIQLDKPDSIARFYANLKGIDGRGGGPIFVINATGVNESAFLTKTSDESFEKQRKVLLDGNFYLAREFARATKERPRSSLLLLSSVVKRRGVPGTTVYSLCKAGLDGLVKTVAAEIGRHGNRINAIEMGYFNAGMINQVPATYQEKLQREIPLGRFGEVKELWTICLAVLKNSYITGATLGVTGGL
jgi:3-oxoacyl-[acyl-carrier protein] reductase